MYEVQTDIPVPPVDHAPAPKRRKYPFETMDVGGMFFVPGKTKNTLAPYVAQEGKKLGRKFSTRLTWMVEEDPGRWVPTGPDDENAVQGIGVWRTE